MKNVILFVAAMACLLTGCNSMLDKDPRDTFTNDRLYWSNTTAVESYTNKFYDNYVGYSQGNGEGWFYFKSLSDDQGNSSFDDWTFTTIPSTSSYWTDGFKEVRRANYVIQNLPSSSMEQSKKNYFMAVARLNRAWEYYQLVREYGDVEWLSEVITDPDDEHVYGLRTDRDVVVDSVLADLDYAVAHLGTVTDKTQWSSDLALAMKSDVCLYEGTFCKYRTEVDNGKAPDNARAEKYLREAADAAEKLINSGRYSLTKTYGEVYNSLDLGSGTETIFYRNYGRDLVMHKLIAYTCNSAEQWGISKDAFDAFLFTDGKPLATTTLDKSDKAVRNAKRDYSISKALQVRDKRLSVLVDSIICFKGHDWIRVDETGAAPGVAMTSSTGYTIRKYDNLSIPRYYRTSTTTGYTDAPLFWYAVVLLNDAEAKAELGTLTQTDLDKTLNLLMSRAGLPNLSLTPEADPANNMGVSNLLWEIRRCRRCELMTDNWYRYWDLVRWHQLHLIDSDQHPNLNLGANLANVDSLAVDVNADKYMVSCSKTRKFDKKYYLFPVPTNERNLNAKITQNPGW